MLAVPYIAELSGSSMESRKPSLAKTIPRCGVNMAIHLPNGIVIEAKVEEPAAKRFQSTEDISAHFLRMDREHRSWMLEDADAVCEDIFAVMASLKSAHNACITLDTLTSRISNKLWMKVLDIGSDCDETVQTYWVLMSLTEMSRYWTPALVKASKTLLPDQESQEFIKFTSKRYEGLQNQLLKAENAVLTMPVEVSIDDLVQNGATVSVSFRNSQTSGVNMNTNHTKTSSDEQTNGSPLPQIDEQLFDENIAKNKAMDGIFHRAYNSVKTKVIQTKEAVVNFVTACPIWKLFAVFSITVLISVIVLIAAFSRRNIPVNVTASGVWSFIVKVMTHGWTVVKSFTMTVVRTVKGWFAKTTEAAVNMGASAATAV